MIEAELRRPAAAPGNVSGGGSARAHAATAAKAPKPAGLAAAANPPTRRERAASVPQQEQQLQPHLQQGPQLQAQQPVAHKPRGKGCSRASLAPRQWIKPARPRASPNRLDLRL